MFTLLGIHVITRRRVQKKRSVGCGGGGGGSKQVKDKTNHQLQKSKTTWTRVLRDHNVFGTPRGGGKRWGLMPLGIFLLLISERLGTTPTRFLEFAYVTICHTILLTSRD